MAENQRKAQGEDSGETYEPKFRTDLKVEHVIYSE